MTLEEAIKHLTAWIYTDFDNMPKQVLEALNVALSALRTPTREQVENVWRGEWIHKRSPYDYKIFVCKKMWEANQHTGRKYGLLSGLRSRPDGRSRGDGDGDAGGDGMTVRYNGDFLGVKCDACGRIFWTNYQGQSFPQHIRDAKENGWIHKKLGDRWKDFCPDCHEYELQKRRETYFKREDDK